VKTPAGDRRRDREAGATLVEFSLIMVLLFTLLLGIISFGLILSLKQTITQGASEGARAAVAAFGTPLATDMDARKADAVARAEARAREVMGWVEDDHPGATTYEVEVHDCDGPADTAAVPDCIRVRIVYDHTGDNRVVPALPLIDALLPSRISSQADVEL
jgi:Flp pilus assembly protein TadG